eukprot:scaffold2351_cov84-Skeletonema_dohrnii-CCMP3373.AAC.15
MQRKYQQRRQPSLQLRKWLSRKFTADSTIDWGDDDSCESGTPQTGGEEAGRSAIESLQDKSSSDGKEKKNPLRRLWSARGEEAGGGATIVSRQDSNTSDGTKKKNLLRLSAVFNSVKVNNKPTAATSDEDNKHGRKQPVHQQHRKRSSSTPAALAAAPPALVHPPTSTLDESEISVDDDGFLRWHHSKRTVMISE